MNPDDSRFESEFGAVLRQLKPAEDACPDSETLISWHADELTGNEAAHVSEHVKACSQCSMLAAKLEQAPQAVDDLRWARARRWLDSRKWPWQSRRAWNSTRLGMLAAGIAAVVIVGMWLLPSPAPDIAPMTRGATPLTVMDPSGAVERLEFRWQALPIHHAYVVEIAEDEQLVASVETFRPPLQADAGLLEILEPGTPYHWRVRAVDASGETLAESAWTDFQLRD